MKITASPEYNEFDGSLWMTPEEEGPASVIIKIEADEKTARKIAAQIEKVDFL